MVAGLAYNITYGITKPASNLRIQALTTANGFSFRPTTVSFNDYYTLKQSTTVYLRSDIPPGNYTISFNKFESDVQTYFRNILPNNSKIGFCSFDLLTFSSAIASLLNCSTDGFLLE